MPRQRPHAREAVDDLRSVDADAGEDVRDELEEVVDLVLGAHGGLAHVVLEVGRADQHAALERVDEHDAAVLVLEEDLASAGRGEQLGVVEHDVRALRAAHERGSRGRAPAFVRSVQGPEVLTTTSAAIANSSPVSPSRTRTPSASMPTASR